MPADLTIFAAKYLILLDALVAALLMAWLLFPRRHADIVRWILAVGIMLVLSFAFAKIAAAEHYDPRPFTQDHIKPLIPHGADNGFPSDHALLAAAIVAAVLLVRPVWSLAFGVIGVLIDWARVGAGIHHVQDVIGSSLLVALATLIALAAAPLLTQVLLPHIPASWTAEDARLSSGSRERSTQ